MESTKQNNTTEAVKKLTLKKKKELLPSLTVTPPHGLVPEHVVGLGTLIWSKNTGDFGAIAKSHIQLERALYRFGIKKYDRNLVRDVVIMNKRDFESLFGICKP